MRWGWIVMLIGFTACTAPEDAVPPEVAWRFVDATAQAGLSDFRYDNGGFGEKWAPEIVGGGGGFFDYDGDGWSDLLLIGGGTLQPEGGRDIQALWLYRNNTDGTFEDITSAAGLAGVRAYTLGLSAADYDNDGDTDLFVTTVGPNLLLRNDGGVFTDVSDSALDGASAWSTSALFFDADRDGWLDLWVGNYVEWSPETDLYCAFQGEKAYCTPEEYEGEASRFYHNNGDGTFSDWTDRAGFSAGIDAALDKTLGVAELDFDNDGWPDLIVANDTERDQLYHNNGDGTFTERGVRGGMAVSQHGKPRAGMGIDAGVVDQTGEVSLFVGNFSDEMVGVYRHTGNGLFQDRATLSRIGHKSLRTLTFGLTLFDADLDADLDLLLANGHVQTYIAQLFEGISFQQPAQLFLNDGQGLFEEATADIGGLVTEPIVGRGAFHADYDRDGDLDVVLTSNEGTVHLWRNELAAPSFLRIVPEGQGGNLDALGTRIVITANGLRQERRIRTGSSYLSQSERVAHFGLGGAMVVDSLRIIWPDGQQIDFTDVEPNAEYRVVYGSTSLVPVPMTP
ncbi:MAG: CRTAC1 family protein [Rhodothermales bacterium]